MNYEDSSLFEILEMAANSSDNRELAVFPEFKDIPTFDTNRESIAIRHAIKRVKELLDQNEKMKIALKPFSDYAGLSGARYLTDDYVLTQGSRMAAKQLTISDCRKAHEVLKGLTNESS